MDEVDSVWDLLALRSCELHNSLVELSDDSEADTLIVNFLRGCEKDGLITVPDFDQTWDWLNTDKPLSFKRDLRGRLVVLDFFTYCCINCVHILPQLREIEDRFSARGVVVVGVHSAKFHNERLSANIRAAVKRHDIRHAVVNDACARMWSLMHIRCWPTIVVVGPRGHALLTLAGECNETTLKRFIESCVQYYADDIVVNSVHDDLLEIDDVDAGVIVLTSLSFPGKVSVSQSGDRLAVADTGNHRILLLDPTTGVIQDIIGGMKAGFVDGDFREARFSSPQGLCWCHDDTMLYVADTENHAIRKIDLTKQIVKTVAGCGVQGDDQEGGLSGADQPINSPWDVSVGETTPSAENVLFIAMAGLHQIWVLFLEDTDWLKGSRQHRGTCVRFAGCGREENRNNTYPHRAGFAQPSGVVFGTNVDGTPHLYVADSESSTIRSVSLLDGSVKGLVGGERDPTNLFAFGDEDGIGIDAKLQHPLCITIKQPGTVLVADSYNHKVKIIDVTTKSCTTLLGSSGDSLLNEPGGLCMNPHGRWLYIADTNNHSIKMFDFQTESLSELKLNFTQISTTTADREILPDCALEKYLASTAADVVQQEPVLLPAGSKIQFELTFDLSPGLHLTEEAPAFWQILGNDACQLLLAADQKRRGDFNGKAQVIRLEIPANAADRQLDIYVECLVYYCSDDDGTCRKTESILQQPVHIMTSDLQRTVAITYPLVITIDAS